MAAALGGEPRDQSLLARGARWRPRGYGGGCGTIPMNEMEVRQADVGTEGPDGAAGVAGASD